MNPARSHLTFGERDPAARVPSIGEALHDLSNHVHGIAMAVQLALIDDSGLPARHRGYLEQIDCKSEELVRLMDRLRTALRDGPESL